MGYLEVDKTSEALWILYHGVEDLYAWAEMNGLPKDKFLIQSGSVTVEQTSTGLKLYCVVMPLNHKGAPLWDEANECFRTQAMALPYVEPIPEGIGKLIDWDFKVPQKNATLNLGDAA